MNRWILALLLLLVSLPAASADRPPLGVFVRTEPLERIDPASADFLPGFRIETAFGTLCTVPSRNAIELTTPNGTRNIASDIEVDGLSPHRPTGLAVLGSMLWIADTGNRRLLRVPLDAAGPLLEQADAVATRAFRRPVGLAHTETELFASDAWSDRVFVFARDGSLLREIGEHGSQRGFLSGPLGMAIHDDLLYIADSRNSRVQVFQSGTGAFHSEWGLHVIRPHEDEGHLHYPTDVSISGDGETVFVDEPWEDRGQVFRRARNDESIPQRLPLGADDFVHYGSGIDRHDRLLAVTDPDTHSVRFFDLSMETPVLIGVAGDYGTAPHQMIHPGAVAFLEPTPTLPLRLAVADRGNARIAVYMIDWSPEEPLRFRPKLATLVRTVDLSQLHAAGPEAGGRRPIDPVGLCASHDGSLAVLDDANGGVVWFNDRLRTLERFDLPEAPESGSVWSSIRRSEDGQLFCIDSAGRRLVHISMRDEGTAESRVIDLSAACRSPRDVLLTSGNLFIVDQEAHQLVEITPEGAPIRLVGRSGLGAGEFFSPAAILSLANGQIVVVDRGNHRLQFFAPDWSLQRVAGPRLYIADALIGTQAPQHTVEEKIDD